VDAALTASQWAAALFAGAAVLGLEDYFHYASGRRAVRKSARCCTVAGRGGQCLCGAASAIRMLVGGAAAN
jgi:hypothetical protein